MKHIDLYILRHLAVATFIATAVLVFAIWLTQSLRLVEVIVEGAAPFDVFLTLVALSLPNFLTTVLPIALAAAVMFTYNRLMSDNEVVVLRACGLSPLGLARPALLVAVAVTTMVYSLNLYIVPMANREFQQLKELVESEYATVFLREGQFNTLGEGITIYFRERNRSGELLGILIHDSRRDGEPVTIIAEQGVMLRTDTGPRVVMLRGNRQQADDQTGNVSILYFDRYAVDLEILKPDFGLTHPRPRERLVDELLNPPEDDPWDRTRLIATGHQRLSSPLLSFGVTAIALGALLAGTFNRRGQNARIMMAIAGTVALLAADLAWGSLGRETLAVVPLMYLSPVIYPLTIVPEQFLPIYALNPMVGILTGWRWAVIGLEPFYPWMVAISVAEIAVIGMTRQRAEQQGLPVRTGRVHFVETVRAAASALLGVVTDPRDLEDKLGIAYPSVSEPDELIINTDMLVAPLPEEESRDVELRKGPNIASLPEFDPLPDEFELPVRECPHSQHPFICHLT